METKRKVKRRSYVALLTCIAFLGLGRLEAETIAVRYREGSVHGFLVLRTLDGKTLADGDLTQVPDGDRVKSELIFRFRDGSVHDDAVVFSQRRSFHLVSEHLIQKGPAFSQPLDETIRTSEGQVSVRYTDKDGKTKSTSDHFAMPPDISNGMVLTLLKNIRPEVSQTALSMVAATPKPRLVKLVITSQGDDAFSLGASSRKATHYVIKVDIGGVAGLLAPLVGKQPPDNHVWIYRGSAPVFVKFEGPLFVGGPVWRIELANPTWPAER